MKKIIFVLVTLFFLVKIGYAQHVTDSSGKTYYDPEKTKLKEVYSWKEFNTIGHDGSHEIIKSIKKKHGAYFYYYESGKIKINGNFKDDKKHGEWKYFDETGALIKTEKYVNGELKN